MYFYTKNHIVWLKIRLNNVYVDMYSKLKIKIINLL